MFEVGERVRLSGRFLRSIGQYVGEEPFKRWVVSECGCGLCKGGRFVATDEFHECECVDDKVGGGCDVCWGRGERRRHIAAGNLERCR